MSDTELDDKGLALMVYETWLLNGCSDAALPRLSLREWCNQVLGRPLFPVGQFCKHGQYESLCPECSGLA